MTGICIHSADYLFPADYFVLIEPPVEAVHVLNRTYARPVAG
jgi:hypothetical protein